MQMADVTQRFQQESSKMYKELKEQAQKLLIREYMHKNHNSIEDMINVLWDHFNKVVAMTDKDQNC